MIGNAERRSVYNTSQPVYEVHLPRPERASGAAVLLLPGGGLRTLSVGGGTYDEIDAFVSQGIAVMLLEYRTLQLSPDAIARASAPPAYKCWPDALSGDGNSRRQCQSVAG